MRRAVLVAGLLALAAPCVAAQRFTAATVRYVTLFNGEEQPDEGAIVVTCTPALARVRVERAGTPVPHTPDETGWLSFQGRQTFQNAVFAGGASCTVVTAFDSLPPLTVTDEHATILGYDCVKATTTIRSNHIDVWYTEAAGVRGTPLLHLVAPRGLVLRMVRNGTFEVVARGISAARGPALALPRAWGDAVDAATYRARVTDGFITTVPVFDHAQIFFDGDLPRPRAFPAESSVVVHAARGTIALRRVHLPRLDDATVFADLTTWSNGDAYDRTGSIFVVPTDRAVSLLDALRDSVGVLPAFAGRDGKSYQGMIATPAYAPPLEVMRFITPFGVGFYNAKVKVAGLTWADSASYVEDVTDLLPALGGDVWIGAFIGNYDRGGHRLSLRLRYHPNERTVRATAAPRRVVLPLFNTCNVMEMAGQEYGRLFGADTLSVAFDVADTLRDARLRYIVTGHGGWDTGDEFVPKPSSIWCDDALVARFVPWRSDCVNFRRVNPASGNFWNGLSSSDFSRSGWCPGTPVDPSIVPLGDLAPGRHVVRVAIPQGKPEGESFSAWSVSGAVIGTAPMH